MVSTQFFYRKHECDEQQAQIFVHFLYQDPAFGAFDDFDDFVESISCESSKSCQVRGSNPCRGATGPACVSARRVEGPRNPFRA